MAVSPQRRQEIIAALRRGTVPARALDAFAVGLEWLTPTLLDELDQVASGQAAFKAVRGDYGCGKTFLARWFQDQARQRGFVTAEVQISETETPLHRLETVYRRLMEHLATADQPQGALRQVIDGWFFTLEEDVLASNPELDEQTLLRRTEALMESRLATVAKVAPAFTASLRAYRRALLAGDRAMAEGLVAWLAGQPNVSASVKRGAGLKGDVDHFGALGLLQGFLALIRDAGHPGLVMVLDEVETLQRMRSDARDKSLNALRQLMDEIDRGRFPGLYLFITGTPAFFEGPYGVQRLAPLAQRLQVDFSADTRFDNPRAVQVRLQPFDLPRLEAVGARVRGLFALGSEAEARIHQHVDDAYLADLATAVAGRLGGKAGLAPRIFLRKLVADVLDRVEQYPDFDPREHYAPTVAARDLTDSERQALTDVDDVRLDL
ncbi:MAG: BREX system ATP-binding protein BrxD [Gammaproteobacteria bacterium]|nr:BREX system ATP-binding protein BrxD [Gammaproteobacteria bacterium]